MGNLSKRVDRIEEQLEPNKGPSLLWPSDDGTFTEIPGCRSLLDVYAKYILPYERAKKEGATDDGDGIRHNPTE